MDLHDTRFLQREPLNQRLAEGQAQLAAIAAELKTELFGIDEVIDRVIESVRAWYVLPEIIKRPVIFCLWGLTGTGKTQLTRALTHKLGFCDRFVEVQMDGFSNGAGWYKPDSISGMLGESGIVEGEPGILLLDEFQRYRTIDNKRNDIKVARYQDVWGLLRTGGWRRRCRFWGSWTTAWPRPSSTPRGAKKAQTVTTSPPMPAPSPPRHRSSSSTPGTRANSSARSS